jgi:hypothetical protein
MGLGRLAPSLPAFLFKGNFLPHGDKKIPVQLIPRIFVKKVLPKLPGFEEKNSEITIFGQ